ncbi:immunoglobulin superfamily member 1-like [Spea bombifrons]|uniref:immunoglobulin superfamily member 1-like n=1 Tax=Spea bombifrons TaxID=233779 RepID=UPI00234BE4B5|nr:immunoglobulin superfamily member 1-like [Spea bombifrons]
MDQKVFAQKLPKPTIILYTNDPEDVIMAEDNISFVCKTDVKAERFNLYNNSSLILQQTEPTFNLSKVMSKQTGVYKCDYCYQSTCSETSDPEYIYVKETFPEPEITAKPRKIVHSGDNITITCRAPYPNLHFFLYKGEQEVMNDIAVGNEVSYTIESASNKDIGQYVCIYKTKKDSTYQMESARSNPIMIRVKDLQRPSITIGVDPRDSENVIIDCKSPTIQNWKWFQLLNDSKDVENEIQSDKNTVQFTVNRTEYSKKRFYCIYRIRIGDDFADSKLSYSIIVDQVIDYTTNNIIRLLLSAVILLVLGVIVWKHFRFLQERTQYLPTLPPALVAEDKSKGNPENPGVAYIRDPQEDAIVFDTL